MNCNHCHDIVLDIARGVPHVEEAAAREHIGGCEACSRHLQQQQRLTAGLRALASSRDQVPSTALEQRLLAAVDGGSVASAEPVADASRVSRGDWLRVAAAVTLLACAGAAWQWYARVEQPGSPTAAQQAQPNAAAGSEVAPRTGTAVTARAMPAVQPVEDGRTGSPAARPAARQMRSLSEPAGQFVTLPDASMLPPFERGEIVRVRIQLASLASLGFTVQPDAADTTSINADLLVGQDGQPRAIRLVTSVNQPSSRSMQ